jgi:hypothetical protein
MAALRSAPLDHLLAVCRAHALQEAVAGFSLALVWLVCSLHSARSLWFGEAGILCLMRLVVKYPIVLHVFCLAGVLVRNSSSALLGLSVVGYCLETSFCIFYLLAHLLLGLWLPPRRSGRYGFSMPHGGGRIGTFPGVR